MLGWARALIGKILANMALDKGRERVDKGLLSHYLVAAEAGSCKVLEAAHLKPRSFICILES